VAVTVRGPDAATLLKRLFDAIGNKIKTRSFDNFGNVSFGIKEHIDIPGIKYDPQIGILGLEAAVSLTRPGFSIRVRSRHKASVGKHHKISKDEAIEFLSREFGVAVI
jgi:large subunit ribosomal protein L5